MKAISLILILFPIVEIVFYLVLISQVGFIFSIFETFLSFLLGIFFFSKYRKGFSGNDVIKDSLFQINENSFIKTRRLFMCLLGSALLIIPGVISDFIGILLMFQVFQNFFSKIFLNLLPRFNIATKEMNGNDGDDIVEGEFYDLHNDKRNISKTKGD